MLSPRVKEGEMLSGVVKRMLPSCTDTSYHQFECKLPVDVCNITYEMLPGGKGGRRYDN